MSIAKRLHSERPRLTWEEAVAFCLRRDHGVDDPPTAAELAPWRRENRPAGEAAAGVAAARQTSAGTAPAAKVQGTLF